MITQYVYVLTAQHHLLVFYLASIFCIFYFHCIDLRLHTLFTLFNNFLPLILANNRCLTVNVGVCPIFS
jgi:hypothetical protein